MSSIAAWWKKLRGMRTTLDLDDQLVTRAKKLAVERGTTLAVLVEDGLRKILTAVDDPAPYRLNLPVVRGRRPPDVDVGDRARLFEVMARGGDAAV